MTNVVNASFLLTLKHFYFFFFFARKDPAATASGLDQAVTEVCFKLCIVTMYGQE